MLTFGSLFAGIGGLDLGLERAGMRCVWQVEKDDYARRVLAKHWPDVRRWDDVCSFPPQGETWECDVICGGFPCQDISVAGNGAGIVEGTRSGLWAEFARIIRVVQPSFVLVENVAALLDRGMGRVLGDLAALRFDAEWDVLPASAFGAPHERERVFLVAYARGFLGGGRFVFNEQDEIPRDGQWRSSQGVESGRGWKRWLNAACAAVDRNDADAHFRSLDDGLPAIVDSDGWRVAGNAVVPQVAEWIGRRIVAALMRASGAISPETCSKPESP